MFQLNLSREVDEDAELALGEFENWYKHNNISSLLRARKTAREQRDNHQRRGQTPSGFGEDGRAVSRQSNRGGRSNRRGRGNSRTQIRRQDDGTEALNEGDLVKFESDDEVQDGQEYPHATHAPFVWPSGSPYPGDRIQYHNNPGGQFHNYLDDDDDSSKYEEASELYSPFPPEGTPDTIEDDTGALILKGVVYPGMAGFDSATEKDRRMRNQKKDPAVLLKLEANSRLVTRTEEVLDINLEYQRTRDVYDEPSIDGSGDENDAAAEETRTRRRVKAKSSHKQVKPRTNTRSRQQTQQTGKTRAVRSSTRKVRGPSLSTMAQSTAPSRRITRSSTNRQDHIQMHSHGVHPGIGALHDHDDEPDNGQGFRTHVHTPVARPSRRQQHERLPGLALRPGNPNAAFASPTPNFKKSPQRYPGKENSHLLIESTSSYNPYLHPQADSIEASTYNPLCPQPRDGFGYRLYSPYDEESKSTTPSGFNPINGNATYDPAHIPSMTGNPYHPSQAGGDDYPM